MNLAASSLVQKVWNYAHVLKDDGLAFMDYTEQITYLLFLKMAWEQRECGASYIPARYTWRTLLSISEDKKLLLRYHQALKKLSDERGLLGIIFTKPQSKITDPVKLRLLMRMVDSENWSVIDADVKGEAYEGLLAKNAEDVRGGAGQYFTPRPVVRAIVEVMRPRPMMRIADPACGTGGFLIAAFEYLRKQIQTRREGNHLRNAALHGTDLVPNVVRLCAMNLFLHGVGTDQERPVVSIGDSLERPGKPVDIVLTNPPFGKKSSFTVIGATGKSRKDKISYRRPEFFATTSNKQLNFLQHVFTMLNENGRAAVVVPDNVLFEGGAGEKIRRSLLQRCNVHTLLRLPTGIWYSAGIKANVLFFDKRGQGKKPGTQSIWVYDLRSKQNFSLRRKPIANSDLVDFVDSYRPDRRSLRRESDRFRCFSIADIMRRDKANLDIQWQSPNGQTRQRSPRALMQLIVKDLELAVRDFASIEKEL